MKQITDNALRKIFIRKFPGRDVYGPSFRIFREGYRAAIADNQVSPKEKEPPEDAVRVETEVVV